MPKQFVCRDAQIHKKRKKTSAIKGKQRKKKRLACRRRSDATLAINAAIAIIMIDVKVRFLL